MDSDRDLESLRLLNYSQEFEMWFFSSGNEPVAGFSVLFDENEIRQMMTAIRLCGRFGLT